LKWITLNQDNFMKKLRKLPRSRRLFSTALASNIPIKEIWESFDLVSRIYKMVRVRNQFQFKKRKVLELCCGHGFIGAILVELGYASLVHQIDIKRTKSNKKLHSYINSSRLIFDKIDIYDEMEWLLDLNVDIIIGCHLCGGLTDTAIDLAIKKQTDLVVVPCCYGKKRARNEEERQIFTMFGRESVDVYRAIRLLNNNYNTRMRFIDKNITPMNRVLMGKFKTDVFH